MSVAHRLQAPRQDRAIVAEPPLSDAGPLLDANRQTLSSAHLDLLGRSLQDLRAEAQRVTAAAARDYLRQSGEPVPDDAGDSLIVAGHQPELFHPGVWLKNFMLNRLARRHGFTALNLVVDNDTARTPGLRVPARAGVESEWPHATLVPFDRWVGEIPYEERTVRDERLFASFAERAGALLLDWDYRPMLPTFWSIVLEQAKRTDLLGERFAGARRRLERQWGCHNLEVPVSLLCGTEPFAWFAGHLLADLSDFHATYNRCVQEYRHRHGIRSRNHPVPDLIRDGDWLEVPFWGWRSGPRQRGRLLARGAAGRIELRAGGEAWPALSRRRLVEDWLDLERQGYKVRSRALTNTMYCRLFLADLFIHGIGGGKYDELTDEIIRRHYGINPPEYLVLSGTLRLPLTRYPATPEDTHRLAHELRDLRYNPERHLSAAEQAEPAVRELTERRREWLDRRPEHRSGRRDQFRVLRTLTDQLRGHLNGAEERLGKELTLREQQVRGNEVLGRRDYAFCLYPEEPLRAFCTSTVEEQTAGS